MITSLTNNMISSLTSINNDTINNQKNIPQVDIKTIVSNAKSDKRFHKLLNLCIKYDIHLFSQSSNICSLLNTDNLLSQCNLKQKSLTKELSEKINVISDSGPSIAWLVDIDNIYTQYKKKFKEIEIITYVLKNIYNDESLEKLCCITNNINTLSSLSPQTPTSTQIKEQTLSDANKKNKSDKKEKLSKYIAIYTNKF